MSFVDGFKLVPIEWTRLTELFAIRPVGDKTFDPLKFARPVGIHNGFHILLLLKRIVLPFLNGLVNKIERIQTLVGGSAQTFRLALRPFPMVSKGQHACRIEQNKVGDSMARSLAKELAQN